MRPDGRVDESAPPPGQSEIDGGGERSPIGDHVVAVDLLPGLTGIAPDIVELGIGVADAGIGPDRAAGAAVVELHVDHAGDGIGAVLRRGAVSQNFDTLDGRRRNRVHVVAELPLADAVVEAEERHLVPPLAIDEQERLVRGQPA